MPVSVPAQTNVTLTALDIFSDPDLQSVFLRPVPHDVVNTLRSDVTQKDKVRKVTIHVQSQGHRELVTAFHASLGLWLKPTASKPSKTAHLIGDLRLVARI